MWILLACVTQEPADTAEAPGADASMNDSGDGTASSVGDTAAPPDTADETGDPETGAGSTGGKGGPTGLLEGGHTFEEQAGRYTLYVPEDAHDAPLGLAVLMHGDWGSHTEFTSDLELRDWADDTHAMVLSLGAPGSPCWWTPRKHQRADYLVDLLEGKLFGAYDVDLERVHLGGISGGAFWSMGVPMYRELPFEGGFVGACGGDVPREDSETDWCFEDYDSDDPALEEQASWSKLAVGKRVTASTTTGDEWTPFVEDGLALWDALGAETRQVDEGSGGHCAFDTARALRDALYWVEGLEPPDLQ